jgi:hypothetical protein
LQTAAADRLVEIAREDPQFKSQLLAECDLVLEANQPATIEQRGALAFRLLSHYPNKNFDEVQESMIAEDWVNDLEFVEFDNGSKFKIPYDVLVQAMSKFRKSPDANFKPMVGKIIEIVKSIAGYRMRLGQRALQIKAELK